MKLPVSNNPIKPWRIALQIYGIIYDVDSVAYCSRISQICSISFMSFTIIFTGFEAIVAIIRSANDPEKLPQSIAFLGYYMAVFVAYIVLQCKRQSIHKFLNTLSHLTQEIKSTKRKQLSILNAISLFCPLATSLFEVWESYLWRDHTKVTTEYVAELMWIIVVNPLNMFCIFLGVFICYMLNSIFEQFQVEIKNELGKKMDHSSWCRLVKKFIDQHKHLSEVVSDFGNIYAYIYLIYFVFYIALTIFLIRGLNLNSEIANWNFHLFQAVFQVVGLFLTQVFAVASVNSQVLSTVYLMKPQVLIPNYIVEEKKLTTLLTNSELSLYIQQVCANPAALTAGNFFVINKNVIISACATILTYILVLYGNNS